MIVPENHCALFGIMLYVSICFERALTTRNVAEDHVADDLMSALTRIVADRSDGASVLRRLLHDGLRTDGRRCQGGNRCRERQARA